MAWIVVVWTGMKVIKSLRKLLHPTELMVWINYDMDNCDLDRNGNCHPPSTRFALTLFPVWLGARGESCQGS